MNERFSKWFRRGNSSCGITYGLTAVLTGVLLMTIGFWKTLLIAALFIVGYLIGNNTNDSIRTTINHVIPEKKIETFRKETPKKDIPDENTED